MKFHIILLLILFYLVLRNRKCFINKESFIENEKSCPSGYKKFRDNCCLGNCPSNNYKTDSIDICAITPSTRYPDCKNSIEISKNFNDLDRKIICIQYNGKGKDGNYLAVGDNDHVYIKPNTTHHDPDIKWFIIKKNNNFYLKSLKNNRYISYFQPPDSTVWAKIITEENIDDNKQRLMVIKENSSNTSDYLNIKSVNLNAYFSGLIGVDESCYFKKQDDLHIDPSNKKWIIKIIRNTEYSSILGEYLHLNSSSVGKDENGNNTSLSAIFDKNTNICFSTEKENNPFVEIKFEEVRNIKALTLVSGGEGRGNVKLELYDADGNLISAMDGKKSNTCEQLMNNKCPKCSILPVNTRGNTQIWNDIYKDVSKIKIIKEGYGSLKICELMIAKWSSNYIFDLLYDDSKSQYYIKDNDEYIIYAEKSNRPLLKNKDNKKSIYFQNYNLIKLNNSLKIGKNGYLIHFWFYLPLVDYSIPKILIAGETNKIITVENGYIGFNDGIFHKSNIFLPELKNGWHHLICYHSNNKHYYIIDGKQENISEINVINQEDIIYIGNNSDLTQSWNGYLHNLVIISDITEVLQLNSNSNIIDYINDEIIYKLFNKSVFNGNNDKNTKVYNYFVFPIRTRYIRIIPLEWNNHISMRVGLTICKGIDTNNQCILDIPYIDNFEKPLIKASSVWDNNTLGEFYESLGVGKFGHFTGKIDSDQGWSSRSNDKNQWYQINVGDKKEIFGIVTQGRKNHNQWVKSYKVQYSINETDWINVDNNNNKIFIANNDKNTKVYNYFSKSVEAKFIRILPQEWNNHISMRADVLKCKGIDTFKQCELNVPYSQITSSSVWNNDNIETGHNRGRLDSDQGWSSQINDTTQWYQIDLLNPTIINGVITQGRKNADQWIIKYNIEISDNGKNWNSITSDDICKKTDKIENRYIMNNTESANSLMDKYGEYAKKANLTNAINNRNQILNLEKNIQEMTMKNIIENVENIIWKNVNTTCKIIRIELLEDELSDDFKIIAFNIKNKIINEANYSIIDLETIRSINQISILKSGSYQIEYCITKSDWIKYNKSINGNIKYEFDKKIFARYIRVNSPNIKFELYGSPSFSIKTLFVHGTGNGITKEWSGECKIRFSGDKYSTQIPDFELKQKNSLGGENVELKCNTGYIPISCNCTSENNSCNGSIINDNKCIAYNSSEENIIQGIVNCAKTNDESKTIYGNKSLDNPNSKSSINCPADYTIVNCGCKPSDRYYKSCSKKNIIDNGCIIYNNDIEKNNNNRVTAYGQCIKFNSKPIITKNIDKCKGNSKLLNCECNSTTNDCQQMTINKGDGNNLICSESKNKETKISSYCADFDLNKRNCSDYNIYTNCDIIPSDKTYIEFELPYITYVNKITIITGNSEKYCKEDQSDYRGYQNRTHTGKTCQKWSEQEPHIHTITPEKNSNKGIGDHNYCRNPDRESGGTWCYTTDSKKIRESCHIKNSCKNCFNGKCINNELPIKISLLSNNGLLQKHAIRDANSSELVIISDYPQPDNTEVSFSSLNITDKGDKTKYRGWVDITGSGKNLDYCRFIGNDKVHKLSCALHTDKNNQYKYNSIPNINIGFPDTSYMKDESGNGKMDYCRCVGTKEKDKSYILCNEAQENGFSITEFMPGVSSDEYNCYNKKSRELKNRSAKKAYSSKCKLEINTNKVNSVFYNHKTKEFHIFKNVIINDGKKIIIYSKMKKLSEGITVIVNEESWKNIPYDDYIDASVYDPNKNLVLFFKDTEYSIYDLNNKTIIESKNKISDIPSISNEFTNIDSACYYKDNIVYLFKGKFYIKINIYSTSFIDTTPQMIQILFEGFPDSEKVYAITYISELDKFCIFTENLYYEFKYVNSKYIQQINTSISNIFPYLAQLDINNLSQSI